MKTILEIFYTQIVGKSVRYRRREINLSRRGGSPDETIHSVIREKRRPESGEIEEKEFIIHSTSWRYAEPGRILLTYIAYSDGMGFEKEKTQAVPLKKLRMITRKSRRPRSQKEEHRKVVSHAMRHIAFLIQTGDPQEFRNALKPGTVKVFEALWTTLAGEVFERGEPKK